VALVGSGTSSSSIRDALLISSSRSAGDVKRVVDELRDGREDLSWLLLLSPGTRRSAWERWRSRIAVARRRASA
jgi:hypothetical protein